MTRINGPIRPACLCDQHLHAEYRELPRIQALVKKFVENERSLDEIPHDFRLGKGHVKFFYDKGFYLQERFCDICQELQHRGYRLNFTTYEDHPEGFHKDASFSVDEHIMIVQRVLDRCPEKPRRYSDPISPKMYRKILIRDLKTLGVSKESLPR